MLVHLRLQTPPSNKSKGFSAKAAAFVVYWKMLQSVNQCPILLEHNFLYQLLLQNALFFVIFNYTFTLWVSPCHYFSHCIWLPVCPDSAAVSIHMSTGVNSCFVTEQHM
ncbi:hypothetical protein J6590_085125 [Homalodisca vitripennis]|nr:hypothetical protein J6590_085125 [Homalodisca vitripennis]